MMKYIFIFITTFIFMTTLSAKEPFIWADDEDFKPYIYRDKGGSTSGIFKEVMVEAFKRMDIPLEYNVYAWKRAQKIVKAGKADGMVTVPTKVRLEFLNPTNPIIVANERIFARSDNPKIKEIMALKNLDEFHKYKVVEYIGAGWSEEHYAGLDIIWAPKYKNALFMLANKRADIFVISEYIGIDSIQTFINEDSKYSENLKKIIVSPNSLDKVGFTLLIRKDSTYAHIIPKFNETLQEMKDDGAYDKIIQKHLRQGSVQKTVSFHEH